MVHSSYAAALIWKAVVYQLMVLSSAQNNAPGYLGCFDNGWIGGWSLKGVSTFSSSLSVEWCFKYCLNINAYKYAGVVSGTLCYCGSNEDYGRLGREADAECRRYTCPGNSNQYCGGDRRIAVYQISKGVCNNAIGPPGHGSHYVTNPTHVYSNLDNSKFFGTRVQFECDTGYVIQGAETIECTQIGDIAEWSNSVPTCIGTGDTVPPTVTFCPEDSTYFVPFHSSGRTLTWTEPTVVDNSGAFDTTQTRTSGSFFTVGDSQVTYTFTDAAGNRATCTFLVRVIQQGDTVPPTVTFCPEDSTDFAPFQSSGTTVTWTEPTVVDNSDTLYYRQTRISGSFFTVGDYQVTYTFIDAAGNQATCTFLVRVIQQGDSTPPVVTLCPDNIVVSVPFQSNGTTLSWNEPIATDNSGALTTTSTRTSGDFFAANTQTTVIYNFRDAANNNAFCTFRVTINELAPSQLSTTMNQSISTNVTTSSGVPSSAPDATVGPDMSNPPTSQTGTIIGIAVAVIASLLVLPVIVIFRKRQNRRESINCANGSVNKIQADVTPKSTYEIPSRPGKVNPKPHEYDVIAESTYELPSPAGAAESTYETPSPPGAAESTYETPSPAGAAESTYETPSPAGAVNPNPKESVAMSAYEIPRPPTNQNHQFTREQNGIVHEYADFKLSSQELD